MTQKPLPINEIKQLANDIRLIQNFAENHDFDASLINATIQPRNDNSKPWDWSLICASLSIFCMFTIVAAVNFLDSISKASISFLFVLGLLFSGIATISFHKKFENTTITMIAVGMFTLILLIGFGILTPKEAMEEAKQIHKEKS